MFIKQYGSSDWYQRTLRAALEREREGIAGRVIMYQHTAGPDDARDLAQIQTQLNEAGPLIGYVYGAKASTMAA